VSIETFVKVPRAMMGGKCQNAMKWKKHLIST